MSLSVSSTTNPYLPWRDEGPSAVQKADPRNILGSDKLHPELVRRIKRLIDQARREGLNLYVFEGFRSLKRQEELISNGQGVTKAKAGYSFHNYGLAVDIVFQTQNSEPSWAEHHNWKRLGELGKEIGLHWGGDWKSLRDRPHFQLLPNDRIGTIRNLTEEMGVKKMWERIR